MDHTTKLLIVDVEGTGWPRQIGAIFIDIETSELKPLVINIPPFLRESMIKPIKIRDPTCTTHPHYASIQKLFQELNEMCAKCEIVVAHNGFRFDKPMITAIEELAPFKTKEWVCTMIDFKWLSSSSVEPLKRNQSLEAICKNQGVEYKGEHDAYNDCHMLMQCLLTISLTDLQHRLYDARIHAWSRAQTGCTYKPVKPEKSINYRKRGQAIWSITQKRKQQKLAKANVNVNVDVDAGFTVSITDEIKSQK